MKTLTHLFFCFALVPLAELSFESKGEAREDIIPGSRYTSAAGAAMGDAYLPMGDSVADGLFYNPANLARIRRTEVELLNFTGYLNTPFLTTASSNFYQATSLSSYASTLQRSPGQNSGLGGQLLVSGGFPGFGFGILGLSQLAGMATSTGKITYRSLYQIVPSIGSGFRLFDGVLRLGYSLQWVNQAVGTKTVNVTSTIGYDQGLAQGAGFSHNFGIAVTAPIQTLPSFNAVLRNAFNTYYGPSMIFPLSSSPNGLPPTDLMSLDASLSIQPRLGRGAILTVVLEERDIMNSSGDAFLGHFALGMEIDFRNRFFLRGGWGGGYPSAGIGLSRPGAEFSIAWYTEEIGTGYLSQGDTRFVLQYQLRIQ